ncbi:hypothetical protein MPSEU_000071200 [Mayamaea pseudoterrestris]|nr:hypothetical protein MPSEU_000071200 [Mayamaea pseudoterrestris]
MSPKYDFRINPVYHIDVQNLPTGKLLAATKRKVQFKFGFSNKTAIAQGLCGVDARGEEHEVTLVWSLVSGKRYVHADGQEVHYSRGNRSETSFDCTWTMNGGHIIKVMAHAFPPVNRGSGIHQFDLQLDGCSIYKMPKIYELGTDRATRLVGGPTLANHAFALPPSSDVSHDPRVPESRQMSNNNDAAPSATDKQDATMTPAAPTAVAVDLLDAPVDLMGQDLISDGIFDITSVPKYTQLTLEPLNNYQTGSSPTFPILSLANESHTYRAPQHPADYQNQTNVRSANSQNYQSVYPQQSSQQTTMYYAQPPSTMVISPDHSPLFPSQQPQTMLTMAPLSLSDLEKEMNCDQSPKTELERALESLVNVDDITETMQTPEQAKKTRLKHQGAMVRSKPCPARTGYLGSCATLADIQTRVGPKPRPTKEVMRTHAFHPAAAHAGTMVMHDSSACNPPSIGCGVGAVSMQSHQYQQQPSYYQYGQRQQSYSHH